MTKCCDEHDICYDTCGNVKEVCDMEFKKCLYRYCDSIGTTAIGEKASTGKIFQLNLQVRRDKNYIL